MRCTQERKITSSQNQAFVLLLVAWVPDFVQYIHDYWRRFMKRIHVFQRMLIYAISGKLRLFALAHHHDHIHDIHFLTYMHNNDDFYITESLKCYRYYVLFFAGNTTEHYNVTACTNVEIGYLALVLCHCTLCRPIDQNNILLAKFPSWPLGNRNTSEWQT